MKNYWIRICFQKKFESEHQAIDWGSELCNQIDRKGVSDGCTMDVEEREESIN